MKEAKPSSSYKLDEGKETEWNWIVRWRRTNELMKMSNRSIWQLQKGEIGLQEI